VRIWRAVLFDLDDTLYPESSYVRSGFRAVAEWAECNVGKPAQSVFEDLCQIFAQGERRHTFDVWAQAHGFDDSDLVLHMVRVYRTHAPTISLYRDAQSVLASLRQDALIGLVTDGTGSVQRRKVESLRLTTYLDAIVYSDDLGRVNWKPSTAPFELILSRLGDVAATDAIYVGDNPAKDFSGCRDMGMFTVRVRRPDGLQLAVEAERVGDSSHVTIDCLSRLRHVLLEEGRFAGRPTALER